MTTHQAVVLAAGRGTRLGAITADTPKPLLDLAGRPLLLRTLDALAAAGVRHAIVVVGYRSDRIATALAENPIPGLRLQLVHQQTLDGTAPALALAAPHLRPQQFFVTWGDIFVEPANYQRLAAAIASADGALLVNQVDDPWAGAAVYIDAHARVTRIVEKPPPGSSTTRWNNAGPAIYGPWLWPFLHTLQPSPRGEYELPRAVAAAIQSGITIRAVPVEGPWFDIGTPESLAAARRYAESQARGIVHP